MRRYVIRARAVATAGRPLEDRLLVVSGKRIESILPSTAAGRLRPRDFLGHQRYLVMPGLVDVHSHGGGGVDPNTLGGLLAAAYFHASHGTTALMHSDFFTGYDALARTVELIWKTRPLASLHLLGLHLEGPFINPEARGAVPDESLLPPSVEAADRILQIAGSELRMITVAPELPGAEEVIRRFTQAGVVVALGHSLASADQTRAGADWGAKVVTHLGNAMRPFHQRDPGMIGAALADQRLTAEVIADGSHLARETLGMFLRGKQGDLMLVSDCRWVGGLPEGSRREAYGRTVAIDDGAARFPNGGLAGSIHPVWRGVTEVAKLEGASVWDAVRMASAVPAKVFGLKGAGRLAVDGLADFVLAGPDLSIRRVFFAGSEVYRAPGEPPLPA